MASGLNETRTGPCKTNSRLRTRCAAAPTARAIGQQCTQHHELSERGNCFNLILLQFKNGRRSALKEAAGVPAGTGQWHELRLTVEGSIVVGTFDGKDVLTQKFNLPVAGRIGLWSKATARWNSKAWTFDRMLDVGAVNSLSGR